jgi:hypothetical protein
MASKKTAKLRPLTKTILSTAEEMYAGGVMNKRAYEKITLRRLGEAAQVATKQQTNSGAASQGKYQPGRARAPSQCDRGICLTARTGRTAWLAPTR